MTSEEVKRRIAKFDESIKDAEGVPKVQQQLAVAKQKFIDDNPIISPSPLAIEKLKKFITSCPKMEELKERASILACNLISDPVLIQGETGTGKEIIAQALHGERAGEFVGINCAGLPEYLIESELFGHVRGAFTGADFETVGLFGAAANGTIFLDEIGELPLSLQAKLLRVLQERKYRKVGSTRFVETSARVISATHHDLDRLVTEGKFRADLYARLNTFVLRTIPLKERPKDVQLIVDALDSKCYMTLSDGQFDWTGGDNKWPLNVRDIQRVVRQWQVFGKVL